MDTHELFGLPLSRAATGDEIMHHVDEALVGRKPVSVTFVNPYSWSMAREQPDYATLLRRFDLVLADGIGVVAVARRIARLDIQRFSFDATSLYRPVFERLALHRHRLFVIGAVPGIADQAMRRMQETFPGIDYCGCRDGYGDLKEQVAAILEAKPDAVLCGMGAPYQERLLVALREAGFNGLSFTCGGFLDQLAASEDYYPAWIDRHDLRWAWRLWSEPGRLWRRYLIDYAPFLKLAAGAMLTQRAAPAPTQTAAG